MEVLGRKEFVDYVLVSCQCDPRPRVLPSRCACGLVENTDIFAPHVLYINNFVRRTPRVEELFKFIRRTHLVGVWTAKYTSLMPTTTTFFSAATSTGQRARPRRLPSACHAVHSRVISKLSCTRHTTAATRYPAHSRKKSEGRIVET